MVSLSETVNPISLRTHREPMLTVFHVKPDDLAQTLAVSSTTGHVALFDLSSKLRLLHLLRAAHEGAVGGIAWVPGQPLLMTSGGDNSMKVIEFNPYPYYFLNLQDCFSIISNGTSNLHRHPPLGYSNKDLAIMLHRDW